MRDEWEQWRGGAEAQGSRGTKERPSLDPRYYRLTPILALLLLLAVGCVPLPTQSLYGVGSGAADRDGRGADHGGAASDDSAIIRRTDS